GEQLAQLLDLLLALPGTFRFGQRFRVRGHHSVVLSWMSRHVRSASHFNALMLGTKKYSPPLSTLKVWMPWMRRLTGSFGIVKVPSGSCRPMIGSRSLPAPMKLPSLIHSCCRNSIVAIALALMNRKMAPCGTSSSCSESAFGSYGAPYVVPRLMRR